jgi:hypothetical protein
MAVCYIFVVVDGFAQEEVWVISRILKEFPCNTLPVLPDRWKICFPMELSVSDEQGCVEGGPEEFVLYDLQFLELRVGHVTPDHDAVHHCRSDYRSIDRYFVLCGQLASPANQRIKFSTNSLGASFHVLDLSVESEVIVEFDSEVFYFGFPRDDAVEHDNLAGRAVKPSGEQNRTTLFWIHEIRHKRNHVSRLSTALWSRYVATSGDPGRMRIAVSSAYNASFVPSGLEMSAVKIVYKVGDSTEPCGTPASISRSVESACPIFAVLEKRIDEFDHRQR